MFFNENKGEKKPAISYWSKKTCTCPVCGNEFPREEMHSGQGRMIAGELTNELHRKFEPSAKFGKIYPLIYQVGACQSCSAAFFWSDFETLQDEKFLLDVKNDEAHRVEIVRNIFPHYDLKRERTLYDGIAMYMLALCCYDKVSAAYFPTIKRGVICLRLAWLTKELDEIVPNHNFNAVSDVFYKKALFFYQQTLVNEANRSEVCSSIPNAGPDIDKNYGWDGVVYLCGLLEYKYGQHDDPAMRLRKLEEYKYAIARIFGFGKTSKAKPGPLLEKSKELYALLSKEIADGATLNVDVASL